MISTLQHSNIAADASGVVAAAIRKLSFVLNAQASTCSD